MMPSTEKLLMSLAALNGASPGPSLPLPPQLIIR